VPDVDDVPAGEEEEWNADAVLDEVQSDTN
jgi:hypothetical protein